MATTDAAFMRDVVAELRPRGVVFLDSLTTGDSVAWRAARDGGLRWMRRSVFLDPDHTSEAAIETQFDLLLARARRRGAALAIGHHQFSRTLNVLERRIPEARRRGVECDGIADNRVRIKAGSRTEIHEQSRIVVAGASRLRDGDVVKIVD